MTHPNALGIQAHESMTTARAIVDTYASAERKAHLAFFYPDPPPQPTQDTLRFQTYQAELLAALAEIVRGIKTGAV